eukprot:CFRG3792T1
MKARTFSFGTSVTVKKEKPTKVMHKPSSGSKPKRKSVSSDDIPSFNLNASLTALDWLTAPSIIPSAKKPVEKDPVKATITETDCKTYESIDLSKSHDLNYRVNADMECRLNPNIKPPFLLETIIAFAINSHVNKTRAVDDIYHWVGRIFPYYRSKSSLADIRKALSNCKKFVKNPNKDLKPVHWIVNDGTNMTPLKRRAVNSTVSASRRNSLKEKSSKRLGNPRQRTMSDPPMQVSAKRHMSFDSATFKSGRASSMSPPSNLSPLLENPTSAILINEKTMPSLFNRIAGDKHKHISNPLPSASMPLPTAMSDINGGVPVRVRHNSVMSSYSDMDGMEGNLGGLTFGFEPPIDIDFDVGLGEVHGSNACQQQEQGHAHTNSFAAQTPAQQPKEMFGSTGPQSRIKNEKLQNDTPMFDVPSSSHAASPVWPSFKTDWSAETGSSPLFPTSNGIGHQEEREGSPYQFNNDTSGNGDAGQVSITRRNSHSAVFYTPAQEVCNVSTHFAAQRSMSATLNVNHNHNQEVAENVFADHSQGMVSVDGAVPPPDTSPNTINGHTDMFSGESLTASQRCDFSLYSLMNLTSPNQSHNLQTGSATLGSMRHNCVPQNVGKTEKGIVGDTRIPATTETVQQHSISTMGNEVPDPYALSFSLLRSNQVGVCAEVGNMTSPLFFVDGLSPHHQPSGIMMSHQQPHMDIGQHKGMNENISVMDGKLDDCSLVTPDDWN